MNIEYVGRGYDVSDRDRELTVSKLEKVSKFLDEPVEVHLEMAVEKHRHIADLHIHHRHGSLQAQEISGEMATAIMNVIDKAEKQARRAKNKHVDKRRRGAGQWPMDVVDATSVRAGGQPRVIKSTNLRIKPMSIEEAALQLDTSRNDFIVFRDSETDEVSVLYKRRDENYGLIAPGP